MTPLVSHLLTFLTGVFVGAAANYLADRFTDERRAKQKDRAEKKRFQEVESLMPELIAEMRTDMQCDVSGTKRVFFPYNIGAITAPSSDMLFYEPKKYPDLHSKLMVLENHGYISSVSTTSTARFRMTEEFVRLLKRKTG